MLDKNGLPVQFPPSAFSAFPGLHPGFDPRSASAWSSHPALQSAAAAAAAAHSQHPGLPPTSGGPTMATSMFQGADSAFFGLPHPHPALSPNYLANQGASLRTHQDYLNAAAQRLSEMQAVSAMDPGSQSLRASINRANRKRAMSASPYSEVDLSTLIRYSPTALQFLSGGSPTSSGSYGHLSPGALSPALVHSAHLQQLHAHLIRSASSSPFLSPQNSLQASLLHSSAAAAAAVNAAAGFQHHNPYFPFMNPTLEVKSSEASKLEVSKQPETCSNVVSSTMEDEDSSREGLTPLTTVKLEPGSTTGNNCETSTTLGTKRGTSSGHHGGSNSYMDAMIKEEPDFVETHCSWVGCDRDLPTPEQLVKHLNNDHIGNSKKAFVCQWKDCSREEKPFKAQYMLVVHMRRHTGEKPHRCTFENCAKAYSRLENLKTHLRSHTGEKPYTCEFPGCSKAFSNASDRAKHQNRTHSNEKPYACKAPGCIKRYTDPSSLRKHVKTVHGHEFYANKRHKGNQYDSGPDNHMHPNTPRTPHSVSTNKSEIESSPGPISPPEERHNVSSGSGNSSAAGGAMMANMPLSDNNVSTTHNPEVMSMANNWDMPTPDTEQDINMAVAVAIGVGGEDPLPGGSGMPANGNNALSQRLSNKMKMLPPHPALGEINRSIEKMSIGTYNAGQHCGMAPGQTQHIQSSSSTMPVNAGNARRGSNWTNSTEGYGSMRSEQSIMSSRRCSDVSAMSQGSNVSTRAMMNSPWDPLSADSSRRSSMTSAHGGGATNGDSGHASQGIGQHLNRLHRRAQHHQMMHATPNATPTPMSDMSGRGSAMSDMTATPTNPMPLQGQPVPMQPQGHGSGSRRASDPVRGLDRNYGVDGQLSRHQRSGSYNQLNMGPQQQQQQNRVPMHGQRIRGMSGDSHFHQQQQMLNPTAMYPPNQQQQQQQQHQQQHQQHQHQHQQRMAAPIAGNGQQVFQQPGPPSSASVNTQFPYNNSSAAAGSMPAPASNNSNASGYLWSNQQAAAAAAYPINEASAQSQQYPGYPESRGNFGPPGQFNGGQWQANNWNAGWSATTMTNGPPSQQQQQQQQQQQPQQQLLKQASSTAGAAATPCDNNATYQRTFDYVQQCQSWTAQ